MSKAEFTVTATKTERIKSERKCPEYEWMATISWLMTQQDWNLIRPNGKQWFKL